MHAEKQKQNSKEFLGCYIYWPDKFLLLISYSRRRKNRFFRGKELLFLNFVF